MKFRTLLALALLGGMPALVFAQEYPEPPSPPSAPAVPVTPVPRVPATPKAPRVAVPAVPAPPAMAATMVMPPEPPAVLQTPKAPPAPVTPAAPAVPAVMPAPAVAPRPMGQMINVRIDVTLSDSKGVPKVLTMTVADGENGMNRTTSAISAGQNMGEFSFNADAAPTVIGNKIRLRLTADAAVPIEADSATPNRSSRLGLRQSQTVILNDGDSVEIARAADPVSDRTFTLSVKVKIQR
jgi:hypothetical protein